MMMTALLVPVLASAASVPVTVEIVASGHVETAAQKYRVAASLNVCAPSQAEADRQLAAKGATIDAALSAINVVPAVDAGPRSMQSLFSDAMRPGGTFNTCGGAFQIAGVETDDATADKPKQFGASRAFSLDAPDMAAAATAKTVLIANGAKPGDKLLPLLTDDTAARQAAKRQALVKARAEAGNYARLLGASATRLVKVSERQDLADQATGFMGQMMRMIGTRGDAAATTVATDVTVTVEFALDGAR